MGDRGWCWSGVVEVVMRMLERKGKREGVLGCWERSLRGVGDRMMGDGCGDGEIGWGGREEWGLRGAKREEGDEWRKRGDG